MPPPLGCDGGFSYTDGELVEMGKRNETDNKETVMGDRAETEVRAVIDTFSDGVRNRDIEAMESVIAHEPNIVFYGSQAGDKRVGWGGHQDLISRAISRYGRHTIRSA